MATLASRHKTYPLFENSENACPGGWDIAILKRIRILENHSIQFRAEFFNAFNHAQFSNPNYCLGATYALPNVRSGTFGNITSTSVNPRVIQFALKYSF
jgi:hypothetical protein